MIPGTNPYVPIDFIDETDVWELTSLSFSGDMRPDVELSPGFGFSNMSYSLHFKRKSLSYIYGIILPCSSLMFLQFSAFLMPPQLPERPSFSGTILLAFYIVQTIVDGSIPNTSKTLLITVYIVSQIAISVLVTSYFMLACNLAMAAKHKKKKGEKNYICGTWDPIRFADCVTCVVLLMATLAIYVVVFCLMLSKS